MPLPAVGLTLKTIQEVGPEAFPDLLAFSALKLTASNGAAYGFDGTSLACCGSTLGYRLHVDGRPSTEVARRPEALTEAVAE